MAEARLLPPGGDVSHASTRPVVSVVGLDPYEVEVPIYRIDPSTHRQFGSASQQQGSQRPTLVGVKDLGVFAAVLHNVGLWTEIEPEQRTESCDREAKRGCPFCCLGAKGGNLTWAQRWHLHYQCKTLRRIVPWLFLASLLNAWKSQIFNEAYDGYVVVPAVITVNGGSFSGNAARTFMFLGSMTLVIYPFFIYFLRESKKLSQAPVNYKVFQDMSSARGGRLHHVMQGLYKGDFKKNPKDCNPWVKNHKPELATEDGGTFAAKWLAEFGSMARKFQVVVLILYLPICVAAYIFRVKGVTEGGELRGGPWVFFSQVILQWAIGAVTIVQVLSVLCVFVINLACLKQKFQLYRIWVGSQLLRFLEGDAVGTTSPRSGNAARDQIASEFFTLDFVTREYYVLSLELKENSAAIMVLIAPFSVLASMISIAFIYHGLSNESGRIEAVYLYSAFLGLLCVFAILGGCASVSNEGHNLERLLLQVR